MSSSVSIFNLDYFQIYLHFCFKLLFTMYFFMFPFLIFAMAAISRVYLFILFSIWSDSFSRIFVCNFIWDYLPVLLISAWIEMLALFSFQCGRLRASSSWHNPRPIQVLKFSRFDVLHNKKRAKQVFINHNQLCSNALKKSKPPLVD